MIYKLLLLVKGNDYVVIVLVSYLFHAQKI